MDWLVLFWRGSPSMVNIDVDSSLESSQLKHRDRILQRLALLGIPGDCLLPGLVEFVKDDKTRIPELVSAILPTDEEMREAFREAKPGSKKASTRVKRRFRDSVEWLKWLMFEGEPAAALEHLSKMSVGQRGV